MWNGGPFDFTDYDGVRERYKPKRTFPFLNYVNKSVDDELSSLVLCEWNFEPCGSAVHREMLISSRFNGLMAGCHFCILPGLG